MTRRDIIVVGASAGGIDALRNLLAALPKDLPASVFVVLHTSEDSPGVLPEVLNRTSPLPVLYAVHNAPILPGRVYVAPSGAFHLEVDRSFVRLVPGPRENRHRPSVDALFRSAAIAFGPRVVGVILTGYLDDGSAGLGDVKRRGGIAVVQSPDDAIAPSMPRNAIENVKVDYVLPLAEIGPKLETLVSEETNLTQEIGERARLVKGEGSLEETGSTYSCPECGGVLREVREGGLTRFECRVGHIYSPDSLDKDQILAIERALCAAIRSLEEHAEFSARLANNARRANRMRLAARFGERAKTNQENAGVVRELLEESAEQLEGSAEAQAETGT